MTPYQALNLLTRRQFECLVLASLGYSNAEIARRLRLSYFTVTEYFRVAYYRLDLHGTPDARIRAVLMIYPAIAEMTHELDEQPQNIKFRAGRSYRQHWQHYCTDER